MAGRETGTARRRRQNPVYGRDAVSAFLRVSAYALAHTSFHVAGWFWVLATIASSMALATVFFLLVERPFILRLTPPAGSRR